MTIIDTFCNWYDGRPISEKLTWLNRLLCRIDGHWINWRMIKGTTYLWCNRAGCERESVDDAEVKK